MFEKLERSWELVKASANVLKQDKELLLFPALSAVTSIVLTIVIFSALFASGAMDNAGERSDDVHRVLFAVGVFGFYIVQYTVIFFFNAALVGAALIRLRGGDPTVGDGFRVAGERFGAIFGYALINATVGIILNTLTQRGGAIGRFIARLLGAAWNITTFLAVPALITENLGPVASIKRSAALLKKTWGEQLAASFGINLVFNWLIFFSCLLFGGGAYVMAHAFQNPAAMLVPFGLFMTWVIGLCLLRAALGGIYAAALYRYSAEGETGTAFDAEIIRGAFQPKLK